MENVTEFLSDGCRKYDGMALDFKIILGDSELLLPEVAGVRVRVGRWDLLEGLRRLRALVVVVVGVGVGVDEAPTQPAQLRSLV